MIPERVPDSVVGAIAEGTHTAFRKATDWDKAMMIHRLIDEMPMEDWGQVVDFIADGVWSAVRVVEEKVPASEVNRAYYLPDGTWVDPDCFECGGEGAACCEPPYTPSKPAAMVSSEPSPLARFKVNERTGDQMICSNPGKPGSYWLTMRNGVPDGWYTDEDVATWEGWIELVVREIA